MATAQAAVPICARCQEQAGAEGLFHLALRGDLVAVCPRCFLLEQIGDLTAALPRDDATRTLVAEGLTTLYEIVRDRSQAIALEALSHGAEAHREGQGRS